MKKFLVLALALLMLCAGCETDKKQVAESSPTTALTAEPMPTAPTTPTPIPTPTPTPEPTPTPLPLEGHIICVDPGHGITSERAKEPLSPLSGEMKASYVSGTQGASITEEQLNLSVGLKLRDKLEMLGAEVVITRETHEATVSNIERCQIATDAGAEVSVRIHADGAASPDAHGVAVLIPTGDLLGTPSIKEESARLGQLMVDAVAEQTGAKNRGTVGRYDLTGFNHAEIPTVLIEMGFMTNPEEDANLATEAYQDRIVSGMVDSILEWYGVTDITSEE